MNRHLALAMTAKAFLEEPHQCNRVALMIAVDESLAALSPDRVCDGATGRAARVRQAKRDMKKAKTHREALEAGWSGGLTLSDIGKIMGGKAAPVIELALINSGIADASEIAARGKSE